MVKLVMLKSYGEEKFMYNDEFSNLRLSDITDTCDNRQMANRSGQPNLVGNQHEK
jgi:hypothetical protein